MIKKINVELFNKHFAEDNFDIVVKKMNEMIEVLNAIEIPIKESSIRPMEVPSQQEINFALGI